MVPLVLHNIFNILYVTEQQYVPNCPHMNNAHQSISAYLPMGETNKSQNSECIRSPLYSHSLPPWSYHENMCNEFTSTDHDDNIVLQ